MKKFFSSNKGLMLFSLVLAIITWYAIRENISFEIVVKDVPINLQIPKGWAVLSQSEKSVEVTFRGSQAAINALDRDMVSARVKVDENSPEGHAYLHIDPRDIVGEQTGVRPVRIAPESIQVSLGHEVTKKIPVKGKHVGKPLVGNIAEIVCDPPAVTIHGPAQLLDYTEILFTTPVDVDGRVETFSKRCKVLPPSNTWTPRIDPEDVLVTVEIVQKSESMEWENVPVSLLMPSDWTSRPALNPETVTVRITGTAEAVSSLTNHVPKVFVDCEGLDPSLSYELPLKIYLPPPVEASASTDPPFVQLVPGTR